MFVFDKEAYLNEVKTLIAEADDLICAVAFWGQRAEELFANREKKKTRIICNLKSGATNPNVIKKLQKYADIRQHDSLHAKVIAGGNKAIVGSANFSCNGLSLEEEQEGWKEAGVVTKVKSDIVVIKEWFEAVWDGSDEISQDDIKLAQFRWISQRNTRIPTHDTGKPLIELPITSLKDLPIYLTITRSPSLSDEAKSALNEVREHEQTKKLYAYENWSRLPRGALIDIYYGPRGRLKCWGVYEIVPGLIEKITYVHGGRGEIQICRKSVIKQAKFNRDDIVRVITPAITEIMTAMGNKGWGVIEFWKAIKIANSHSTIGRGE